MNGKTANMLPFGTPTKTSRNPFVKVAMAVSPSAITPGSMMGNSPKFRTAGA